MAARSTTAGTPVKSWRITLAGLKGISTLFKAFFSQSRIVSMSDSKNDDWDNLLTHNCELITISNCALKKYSD